MLTEEEKKAKTADYQRAWRKANKKTVALKRKEYNKANKEKIAIVKKKHYQKNRHEILLNVSKYKKNNKGKCSASCAKYRATRTKATPPWFDKEEVSLVYELSNMLTELSGEQYHVDHIIPLHNKEVCGLHTVDNLQVLLAVDNFHKSNNLIDM